MVWSIASLFARSASPVKKRAPHRNRLRLERLEDRLTPAGFFLTGVGGRTDPAQANARIYDATAADSSVVGPGDVNAFPGTGTERRITAFSGVSVAAGDVDGDGNDELFVSKNLGLSDVRVYKFGNLVSGGEYAKFVAFEGFQGEVRLGAADVDGDGRVEVLTSTGDSPGAGGAHVKAWRVTPGDAGELRSFFAYPGYSNGVFLGTNDFHWFQDFDNTAPVNIPDPGAFVGTSITVNPTTLVDSNRFRTMSIFIRIALLDPDGAGENSDLDVFLHDPRGVNHPLFTGANFFGDGFNIELTDSAPTALTFGTLPNVGTLTGRFRPETINLGSTFNNLGLAGTWTLTVRDTDGGNAYRLTDWGISFGF